MEIMQKDEMKKVMKAVSFFLVIVSVFFVFKIVQTVREYRYIGAGMMPANTISVDGDGEVFAIPDTAVIGFTVRNNAGSVKEAQDATTAKTDEVLAAIRALGVEDKDIKTTSYSTSPTYKWSSTYSYPRPTGEVTGYDVAQSVEVKVRDTENTGKVLEALGTLGVTETYGPNYSIDDPEALQAEARKMAIDEAQAKADILARDLGVKLVRIVSFNEGGYYPYAVKNQAYGAMEADMAVSAPQVPAGESSITSQVTITYEIR